MSTRYESPHRARGATRGATRRTFATAVFVIVLASRATAWAQVPTCEGDDPSRGDALTSHAVSIYERATAHRDRVDRVDLQRALAESERACEAGSSRALLLRALVLHALARHDEAWQSLEGFRRAVPDALRSPAQRETAASLDQALRPYLSQTATRARHDADTRPEPPAPTIAAPTLAVSATAPERERPWRTWAVVASSVTALSLVGAIGASAWRESRASEYTSLGCGASSRSDACVQAWGAFQTVDTLRNVAWVSTGVFAVTTAALWWLDLRARPRHVAMVSGCRVSVGGVACAW